MCVCVSLCVSLSLSHTLVQGNVIYRGKMTFFSPTLAGSKLLTFSSPAINPQLVTCYSLPLLYRAIHLIFFIPVNQYTPLPFLSLIQLLISYYENICNLGTADLADRKSKDLYLWLRFLLHRSPQLETLLFLGALFCLLWQSSLTF